MASFMADFTSKKIETLKSMKTGKYSSQRKSAGQMEDFR
jgi:hypothetical protein